MPSRVGVVFDTNVLYSALSRPGGVCAELVQTVLDSPGRFRVYRTTPIWSEYLDVLHRTKLTARVSPASVDAFLSILEDASEETMSSPLPWIPYPDESDRPFVEAAVYTDSFLVTSNMKDYPFAGLKVVYPQEFMDFVAKKRGGEEE